MQPTRRFWETVAVAAVLAAAALAFAQPLLLLAPAGVVAYLLAAQVGFVHAVGRLDDSLEVGQSLDRPATVTDEPVTATVVAAGDANGLDATVTARTSAGLDAAGDLETDLDGATSFAVSSNVAGAHRLEPPEVEVGDPLGLFSERFTRGEDLEVLVEARQPRDVHVGEGGRELRDAYGQHTLESTGPGLMPAELREYVSGEPASNIDWNATARLASPYVREFEAESDQTTVFVVDARSSLRVGPPGGTALEYLRTVALSHVTAAQRLGDPVGCVGVDDRGVRRLTTPTNAAQGYEIARRRLRGLSASRGPSRPRLSPPVQRRAARYDPDSRFGEVLERYVSARPAADPERNPLQTAVRTAVATTPGTVRVVLYTDDTDRAGVEEVVSEARRRDHPLDVFLAPTVLFESDTLADLEGATERYRDFERFRRELVEVEGVSAYEVAPRSRIETVTERRRAAVRE